MKKTMISSKANGHAKVTSATHGRSASGDTAYIPNRNFKGDVSIFGKTKPSSNGVVVKGSNGGNC